MRQLMTDSEIDIAFAFNPAEASNAVAKKLLPSSVRSFVLEAGTIGNTHFVAIPLTASSKEGAMVVADFSGDEAEEGWPVTATGGLDDC